MQAFIIIPGDHTSYGQRIAARVKELEAVQGMAIETLAARERLAGIFSSWKD